MSGLLLFSKSAPVRSRQARFGSGQTPAPAYPSTRLHAAAATALHQTHNSCSRSVSLSAVAAVVAVAAACCRLLSLLLAACYCCRLHWIISLRRDRSKLPPSCLAHHSPPDLAWVVSRPSPPSSALMKSKLFGSSKSKPSADPSSNYQSPLAGMLQVPVLCCSSLRRSMRASLCHCLRCSTCRTPPQAQRTLSTKPRLPPPKQRLCANLLLKRERPLCRAEEQLSSQ